MIAFLNGVIDSIDEDYVYIDCAGVGYRVMMPSFDLAGVGEIGDTVKIYTYFNVKENEMSLYGFESAQGKELFEMLISVNGIGPKNAIAILSELTTDRLYTALATGDVKAISSAKGVGKKIAERAILELGSKIDNDKIVSPESISNANAEISYKSDIIMALESLGYNKTEANEAVRNANYTDGMTEEEFLKECLKTMI
ncbi:MAG: Holliday junction branch migration protein RuvA [Lachnospiraceae bacterium]|nr:Holliday junction branch migration protein RuvA [Lachnospiraceae bacterium]